MTSDRPPGVPSGAPPPPLPPPPSSSTRRWRAPGGLEVALVGLLVLDAVAALVAIPFLADRLRIFGDIEQRGLSLRLALRDERAAERVETIAVTILVLMLVTAVVFVIWTWRAAKNNEALGRPQPRFGPGWAVGGWLIPLANFVIPVLVVQDLWRGSDPSIPRGDVRWKIADRSALVGWWWGAFLASRLLGLLGRGDPDEPEGTIDELRTNVTLAIVGAVLSVAAAVLAVLVVRAIGRRQERCLRAQHGELVPPAPPAG